MTETTKSSKPITFKEIRKVLKAIDVKKIAKPRVSPSGVELNYVQWADALDAVQDHFNVDFRVIKFDINGFETEGGLPYQTLYGAIKGQDYTRYSLAYNAWMKHAVKWVGEGKDVPEGYFTCAPAVSTVDSQREIVGYNVEVEVTIEGFTKRMWLPIMDINSLPVKDIAYTATDSYGYAYHVPAINAQLVNKSIMRCLVKCLALFGFGVDVYKGGIAEDTDSEFESTAEKAMPAEVEKPANETPPLDESKASLDEAMQHIIEKEGGKFKTLVGKRMYGLIEASERKASERGISPKVAREALAYYCSNGTPADQRAARVLLEIFDEKANQAKAETPETKEETD